MSDTFSFVGNIEFDDPKFAALTLRVPMRVLRSLIASPSKSLSIERHEIIGLLRIIEQNPNTSDHDLVVIRGLLDKA